MNYESDSVNVGSLPPSHRLLGALGGIPVLESEYLKYDEMSLKTVGAPGILVGEARHFLYRMQQLDRNHECREAARRHIEAEATRILGEPWKVSPR